MTDTAKDDVYFELLMKALRVCRSYKPMFGKGRKGGLSLSQFQDLYQSDPFYSWFGLDSSLIYAARKAAGGITSVYRQIGIGSQWVFSQMLQDSLLLPAEDVSWKYQVPSTTGKHAHCLWMVELNWTK